MSLGGPSGAGGLPPPQVPASSAALRQLAQAGWIDGRVSALLSEGGARISTFLGLVVAPELAPGVMPGDRVRLRMNPQTGQIEAQPLRPGAQPAPGAPPPPSGAPGLLRPLTEALTPHLPSAALASLAPILPGAAGALGAALPPPGSALYGLIAALFAGEAGPRRPGGVQGRRRSAPDGEELPDGAAEDETPAPLAAEAPAPPRRDPLDVIDWAGTEVPEDGGDAPESLPAPADAEIAWLTGQLPEGGEVRLNARRSGGHITLEVTSDGPLPAEIARLIRAQAEALARAWDARLSCTFRHGAGDAPGFA